MVVMQKKILGGSDYVVYCDVSSVGVGCVLMQPEFDIYTDHKRLKYIFQHKDLNLR